MEITDYCKLERNSRADGRNVLDGFFQVVQGMTHNFGPGAWDVIFNVTPEVGDL
jgi:hypothetical protein